MYLDGLAEGFKFLFIMSLIGAVSTVIGIVSAVMWLFHHVQFV